MAPVIGGRLTHHQRTGKRGKRHGDGREPNQMPVRTGSGEGSSTALRLTSTGPKCSRPPPPDFAAVKEGFRRFDFGGGIVVIMALFPLR